MSNYEYFFNDGTGSTIAEANSGQNLSIIGSPIWGADNLRLNGYAGANYFESPNGFLGNLASNSFSIALWFEYNTLNLDQNRSIFNIGSGDNFSSIWIGNLTGVNSPFYFVTNWNYGVSSGTEGGPSQTILPNIKYLIISLYYLYK